uniref:Calcineurin-like phosphoesterase n=1 Tax=viral metagenome TaxID=1070528 RepID=A0A6M3Y335_9ZZZZ
MIVSETRIPYKFGQEIKILPIFDIHLGNVSCDKLALKKDLATVDKNTYIIGGGDWLDSIIVADRKRYRKSADDSAPHEDDIVDQQIEEMYDLVKDYKKQIIGLSTGNHEDTITVRCNTNPIKRLCKMLDTPFLSYSSLLKLSFSENNARGRTVIVRTHHGWGGGSRTMGADLTKYSRDVGCWEADIFLYGHVHKKQNDRVPRLGLSGLQLISRPKIMVICGTYLKTFTKSDSPSYSEKEGYPPTEIGASLITIKPNNKWVDIKVAG